MRSMALTCTHFSPKTSVEKSSLLIKPFSKVLRLKHMRHNIQVKKTVTSLTIRSSFKEKVFEDRSNGIICYADESGEIVCEGYDEGPRYHDQIPKKSSHSRDSEIFDILQQKWINFVRGTELKSSGDQKGVTVQGDINCNGFNSFR